MFNQAFFLAQGRSHFAAPYDSTQGVPGIVFVVFWIIIIAFLVRLAWEYRDVIFKSGEVPLDRRTKRSRQNKAS